MRSEQDKEIDRPFNLLRHLQMKPRKENKVLKQQEYAHLLRLLEMRYLKWRFVNAKALGLDRA